MPESSLTADYRRSVHVPAACVSSLWQACGNGWCLLSMWLLGEQAKSDFGGTIICKDTNNG